MSRLSPCGLQKEFPSGFQRKKTNGILSNVYAKLDLRLWIQWFNRPVQTRERPTPNNCRQIQFRIRNGLCPPIIEKIGEIRPLGSYIGIPAYALIRSAPSVFVRKPVIVKICGTYPTLQSHQLLSVRAIMVYTSWGEIRFPRIRRIGYFSHDTHV